MVLLSVIHLEAQLLVNPGSVGLPAYADETPEPHVVTSGSPLARYVLLEPYAHGWRVELIALAYDHQLAVRQAEKMSDLIGQRRLRLGFWNAELLWKQDIFSSKT
jgi:hypothetical protein